MNNVLSEFGERLTELMFYADINSEQLGLAVGISGESIRRYSKGQSGMNLDKLNIIADYFKCSIDFLLGRTDEQLDFMLHPALPFKERIREVLKENGHSRYSLDKQTRFKDSFFSKWDKGAAPNIFTLIELADFLNCSVDYLVGRAR